MTSAATGIPSLLQVTGNERGFVCRVTLFSPLEALLSHQCWCFVCFSTLFQYQQYQMAEFMGLGAKKFGLQVLTI